MTKKWFFLPTIIIALVLANRLRVRPAEAVASYLTYPVLLLSRGVSRPIKRFFKRRRSYQNLEKHCLDLKEERRRLYQENVELRSALQHMEKTSELRKFRDRYELKNALMSRVLIKTLTTQEHSFVVNRGSRDGVKLDMVAIYKFQLLGRVTEVFSCYSKVTLITDRHSKISAYANTSNTRGIVEGENVPNSCRLKYISHLKSIHENDLVFSSGKGLVFPEGFCLGKIMSVITKDLCHHVELRPLVDLEELDVCHITGISKMKLF